MNRLAVARRLLAMLRPLAPLMVVSSLCRVVNQGLGIAIPALAAAMVARIVDGGSVTGLVWLLAGLAVVKGLFRYVEQFTGHGVAFRLLAELRIDVYRHVEPLAPAGLETERTGDLVNRIIGDVDRVEPFYAHTIAPLVGATVVPVLATLVLAVTIDPVIAVTFLPFPLLMAFAVPWILPGRVAAASARLRRLSGEAAARLTDAVQGSREISALGADGLVKGRIDRGSSSVGEVRARLARIRSVRSTTMDLLAGGAVVAVAGVGLERFGAGAVDLAGLATVIVVAWVGTAPARVLEDIVPDLEQALAAAGRLFDLADRPRPVSMARGGRPAPTSGSVEFEDVSVTIGSRRVLVDVDAEIRSDGLVAVVGPSGSGKSTLVELLLRFRDPDRGAVRLGGTDVRHLAESDLRALVSLVPQRPELFFGTIADNLRLARPDATTGDLWDVLQRAALADWVDSLDRGLDTQVGELGEAMSGGQRQRLTIARGMLRDPKILILDEATSELDHATEELVWTSLEAMRGERTLIVVAHRLEAVTSADEILVMDGGRLVERGTHTALVGADGVYARLWRRHLDVIETS